MGRTGRGRRAEPYAVRDGGLAACGADPVLHGSAGSSTAGCALMASPPVPPRPAPHGGGTPVPASLPHDMGSLIKKRRKRMRKKKHKKMLKATRWQRRAGK